MAWIKLTRNFDETNAYVNTNVISTVTEGEDGGAIISFVGDDNDWLEVSESVEKVIEQILWNEALVSAVEDEVLHRGKRK